MPRRLPVIQSSAAEDEVAASRPRWHWVLIGAGLTITLWAPLVAIATPLGVHLASRLVAQTANMTPRQAALVSVSVAVPLLLAFATAAFGAGALVGRFGGHAGRAQAALGSAAAGGLASLLGLAAKGEFSWASVLASGVTLAIVGALGGFVGGGFGFRKRPC